VSTTLDRFAAFNAILLHESFVSDVDPRNFSHPAIFSIFVAFNPRDL